MTKKFIYGWSCFHVWQASLYISMRVYNLNQSSYIIYILNIVYNSCRSVVKLGIHRAVGIMYWILFYFNALAPNITHTHIHKPIYPYIHVIHIVIPKKLSVMWFYMALLCSQGLNYGLVQIYTGIYFWCKIIKNGLIDYGICIDKICSTILIMSMLVLQMVLKFDCELHMHIVVA
jgi:hypothetical protein